MYIFAARVLWHFGFAEYKRALAYTNHSRTRARDISDLKLNTNVEHERGFQHAVLSTYHARRALRNYGSSRM